MNLKRSVNSFTHGYGKYPAHQNNEQIEKLINRMREKDITDPFTGEFSPTFYKNIDREEMLKDLLPKYV